MLKNNYVKPITLATISFILFKFLPINAVQKCQVPEIDQRKVEISCFNIKDVSPGVEGITFHVGERGELFGLTAPAAKGLLEDPCFESAQQGILISCKIGYRNKKAIEGNNSYLNICYEGKWKYEKTDYGNCEFLCGKQYEEKEISSTPTPLLYKGGKLNPLEITSWHVGIYRNISKKFEQICAGSIIHSNVILSAAHCFYDESNADLYDSSIFWIGAGKRFRKYEAIERNAQFARVTEIHLPPTFQSQPLRSDIAVLILDRHFQHNPFVNPICLDWEVSQITLNVGTLLADLYGWGATSSDGISSEELLKINMRTIYNDECKKLVDPNYRSDITGDRFCAINENNGTACSGDSGGGLVTYRYGKFLTGIVSVGINPKAYCNDGFITLFTNVRIFSDFIKTTIMNDWKKDLFQKFRELKNAS